MNGRHLTAAELEQVASALNAATVGVPLHSSQRRRDLDAALALLRPARDDRQAALEACAETLRLCRDWLEDESLAPGEDTISLFHRAKNDLARLAASGGRA